MLVGRQVCIHEFMYPGIQLNRYVCSYLGMQVFRYLGMQVCRYLVMYLFRHVGRHVGKQFSIQVGMQVSRYVVDRYVCLTYVDSMYIVCRSVVSTMQIVCRQYEGRHVGKYLVLQDVTQTCSYVVMFLGKYVGMQLLVIQLFRYVCRNVGMQVGIWECSILGICECRNVGI